MKRTWQCDYCSHTDFDSIKLKVHEDKCTFNEVHKYCETCDYHDWEGYGMDGWYVCRIGLVNDEIEDKGNCKGWVNEEWIQEQRAKKLEKIVDETTKCQNQLPRIIGCIEHRVFFEWQGNKYFRDMNTTKWFYEVPESYNNSLGFNTMIGNDDDMFQVLPQNMINIKEKIN